MKKFHSLHALSRFAGALLPMIALVIAAGFGASSARADINSINKSIWGMHFGVSAADLANPSWLAADSDGDGLKNSDEVASGTNPFAAGSVVTINNITADELTVSLSFTSAEFKQYVLQGSPNLNNANFTNLSGPVTGSGVTMDFNGITKGANKFFRVLVQDIDTDNDGVSDWAEEIAGYNPNNAMTNGLTPDGTAMANAITESNVVSVSVMKSSATQPPLGAQPLETGAIRISRGGSLRFNAITVPLQISGTALEGTDYDDLPDSVTFTADTTSTTNAGLSEIVLTLNPKYNVNRMTNITAIVQVLPGGGYSLGPVTSGAVVINPAGLNIGTGLTGAYHNQSATPYSANQAIFAGAPELTRVDATIDFNGIASISLGNPCTITMTAPHGLTTGNTVAIGGVTGGTFSPAINGVFTVLASGLTASAFQVTSNCTVVPTSLLSASVTGTNGPNGWGTAAGPVGMSSPSVNGAFSVRWTGRILPQYSETYFIDFRSDDSAKVWVNGKLLIDRWQNQSSGNFVNSIKLTGGVLHDIQIDYLNLSGNAEARLYWWSPSQPKQIVPQGRLFPSSSLADKVTAITSSLTATGVVGTPFSFNVVTPTIGGSVTYAVAPNSNPLPPGLSLNASTGVISGTPTLAGLYNVAVNATNVAAAAVMGSSVIDFTIYPAGSVTREKGAGYATADGTIPVLDDDTDYPNNTTRRLRGYMIPPKTGNYYFWLAANNTAELWIANDSLFINRVQRATVTASTGKKVWNFSPTQRSSWLTLVAGQKYYFDVLHNTGTDADDYVSVGWCQDDVGTVIATSANPNPTGVLTTIPDGGGPLQGYPLSGTVPGYLCQPYDYPAVTPSTGSLYAANMGPQSTAVTSASGAANLRVNAAQTQGILYFNYQNLTTAKTAYHLHVDGFTGTDLVVHPQGEIIFDIDDIDAFHPELITADGGYIWDFVPVGSFTTIAQIREAIQIGKVYLNVHTVTYPGGEIRGTLTLVEGSQTPPDASQYPAPSITDNPATDAGAARFLNQATFGASPTDISYVKANGFNAWIDDQLTKAPSRTSGDVIQGITADINNPYPSALFTDTWWKYSITGPDQLRQRLAFALSEILVISWANDSGPLQRNGRILADYYDNLVDYCLPTAGVANSGNFRGILKAVTLTPAMGLYLDMRANEKGDDTIGRHPNENYAREIMQLFSVGIDRTWDDGKFVLDSEASIVPTYVQPTIVGLSNLLTGWNYAQASQANGRAPINFGPGADYLNPMVLVPTRHEQKPKLLLNNVMSPAATGLTPRVNITSVAIGNPCTITTFTAHGLSTGDTVVIAGVNSGTFTGGSAAINATFQATVTGVNTLTVPVQCTVAAGQAGTVTGPNVTPANFTPESIVNNVPSGGMPAVAGSQADYGAAAYDQYGLNELDAAIDNIVANDNVPPYICRQLIQRLVTSEPSPGYVYRVVQKFKNNGSGVRGDLAAVVRQILLDGEARGNPADPLKFGKQREPMLRLTGPARAFPTSGYTGTYTQLTGVNSNKLRVTTSSVNDFNNGFAVSLDFRGNYAPPGQTLTPGNVPTSTTYSVQTTTAIAATHLDISTISPLGSSPTTFTGTEPHGMGANGQTRTIWLFGLSGKFSDAGINSGGKTATVTSPTAFTVPITTTHVFQIASVAIGTPCTVTTVAPHGLPDAPATTAGVTLNGVTGGTFSGGATSINGTNFTVTKTGANTFTVASSTNVAVTCSVAPTAYTTWRQSSNPVRVTTVTPHGLANGDSITIAGVTGGSFTPTINGTYTVSEVASSAFTIAGLSANSPSNPNTGTILGGNTLDFNATGMVNATYTQTQGSTTMTINTAGPQTDVVVPNATTTPTIKSKVYMTVLSRTSALPLTSMAIGNPVVITKVGHGLTTGNTVTIAGVTGGTFISGGFTGLGAINKTHTVTVLTADTFTVPVQCTAIPTAAGTATGTFGTQAADGVYLVQSNGTNTFTVTTADTPTATRTGNVLIPKIPTSYTPSGSLIIYNNNVNHNLSVGDSIWVDAAVVQNTVQDAQYTVTVVTDEDHIRTSNQPTDLNGGTYPTPSGSNNGTNIWPLVPAPTGRSGSVIVNQSTYTIGSTESTLTQSPLNAPTVFNYFLPYYKFPGVLSNTGLDSPEFQLSTDTNVMNLTNNLTNTFVGTGNGNANGLGGWNNGNGSIVMTIEPYMTPTKTADTGISALIDELSNLLVGGPLLPATKTEIENFVKGKRITGIATGNPCTVTAPLHGLTTGTSVTISGVTGGSFSPAINGTYVVTKTGNDTFTVPVNCTSIAGLNVSAAYAPFNFPYTIGSPTNTQMRDRVRAIIHLIITSAEYAVQK